MDRRVFLKSTSGLLSLASVAPLPALASGVSDVVIIGAGLSGLNAAVTLQDMGLKPLVLEANDRVGGRVFTKHGDDWSVEVGGQEIGAMYSYTLSAVERFGLAKQEANIGIDGFSFLVGDKLYSKTDFMAAFGGSFRENELPFAPSRLKGAYFPEGLSTTNHNWSSPEMASYDVSLAAYMKQAGASDAAMKFVGNPNARPPEKISLLWEARQKAFSSLNSGKKYFQLLDGMDALPKAMAGALGDRLLLRKRANVVRQSAGAGVEVICEDGSVYRAGAVILAVPLTVMRKMKIETELSPEKHKAIDEMNYGQGTCVYFRAKRAYWEEDGLPASMWTDGELGKIYKWRSAVGEYLWNYITGPVETMMRGKSDSELFRFIMDKLAAARPSLEGALEPLFRHSWSTSPFALGTFHYWGPGQAGFDDAFRQPEGKIVFAGEHTMSVEMGLEAAMASGVQAAFEATDLL
ncbi:MAG: NAD(P)/FAD-dependent oxidoreductase [Parvularculaceae bacterium]